jgi:transcriptional regulator with XRE-family HTH domain
MNHLCEVSQASRLSPLRQLRLAAGWTADDLASRAGISSRTVYALEGGHNVPHRSTLRALAMALGCHPQDLLNDHERPAKALVEKEGDDDAHAQD